MNDKRERKKNMTDEKKESGESEWRKRKGEKRLIKKTKSEVY